MTTSSPISATSHSVKAIQAAIRDIPDFPKPGIVFKDVTTVLRDPALFSQMIDYFALQLKDYPVDYVVGIESRGFIMGAPLAYKIGAGFIPIRKKGKLPGPVESHEYSLEYGNDCVEIHKDAIESGSRVILIDDLLATGGTAKASAALLQKVDTQLLGMLFLIELSFLEGKGQLPDMPLYNAMIQF